jgi:signal transduction histidine kinase/HPt (histidine-containing phosphotransfer) domain-containing protein/ActR/RegA family two-component response regulator
MALNGRLLSALGRIRIAAPTLWVAIALPLSYFTAASFSISVFGTNTPVWVSNAFAVTALLRHKAAAWPILLLLAAAADFAAGTLFGGGAAISFGIIPCDVFEILLVAAALSQTGDVALPFSTSRRMAKFVLVCLLVPVVSSAAGSGLLAFAFGAPFLAGLKTWYLAAVFGLLIVTPVLLSWTDPVQRLDRQTWALLKTVLLAGLVAAVGYLDFNYDALPGLFLTFPLLVLAAFEGKLLGATTAAAALAAVATWSTWRGHGPIATLPDTNDISQIQVLQLYLVMVLLSTLPIAAVLEQRERLTVRLQESTRLAEAAVRAKSEFLAVMSHEIRTPMTGVLGMTDLLMSADLPAKERSYVAGIRTSGRHLLALVNDILDFSRIESGKLDLETIDFAIPQMLEQVRSLVAPQAAERRLELRFELDAHAPSVVRGDPTRLKQVLVNLTGNGLKFTHRGSVTVGVSRCPEVNGQQRYRFEVRDTGIGIPAEKRAVLFSVFSQVDSSTTRQYGGSGLGLAISKRLVEAMGGEIGVESVLGVGSRFWFEIPLEPGDATTVEATARHPIPVVPSRRVLLVEDVELNQVLIADMLRSHGHDVTVAENGKEAVAMAAREHFDIVLMDVQMPVMDGVEATRRIRKLPLPAGAVPVLALSANVLAAERERYLAAGMNGALTKPIDWPQLFEAMAHHGDPEKRGAGRAVVANPEANSPALQPGVGVSPAEGLRNNDNPIDSAVLDRLRLLQGGKTDLTDKLAELFVRDTGQRLEELGDAVRRVDAPTVARLAHAIKGSAANLGAQFVVQICSDLETCAEAGDLSTAPARLDELQCEFTRACNALAGKPAIV